MTITEIKAMPGSYIKRGLQTGEWAIFWDIAAPGRYVIARYSHSEVTTPVDRHWTLGKEYYTACVRATPAGLRYIKDKPDAL